jgi:limonene-1,2-epoxide hydrolase
MSEVVDKLVAALNAHDLEAAAALFHENYRSEQPAHPGRAFVGRAQMHANWQAIFAGIPDFRADLIRSVDDGDTTWSEWSWSGNRVDGQDFQVRGVTLFEIKSGQITAGRLYVEDVERADVGIQEAVESLSGRRPNLDQRPNTPAG